MAYKAINGIITMLKIDFVEKNSVGEELGLEQGDAILSFCLKPAEDILDYLYYQSQTDFTMQILTKDGEEVSVEVQKDEEESLGLTFVDDNLRIRTCKNDCIFCFVKQMPKGMRQSLYVKDDDYRQSFICGNFVTLTNVSDEQLDRIIRLKLSPMYVSVHTLDGELRKKMMKNPDADKITAQLSALQEGGIDVHAQVVLVKGVNDGEALRQTLNGLYAFKNVKSVAVVPCGITRFRDDLYPIEDVDGDYSRSVIRLVESVNNQHSGSLIALADEFYFKAKMPLPSYSSYGDFAQIENGVGMSVKFERDVDDILAYAEQPVLTPGKYLTVSGTSAYQFIKKIARKVENACTGVYIQVVAVENDFFGHTVNCTGLLTGQDVCKALKPLVGKCDCVLIPNPCLMQFEDVFLDGITLDELSKKLGVKVKRAAIN